MDGLGYPSGPSFVVFGKRTVLSPCWFIVFGDSGSGTSQARSDLLRVTYDMTCLGLVRECWRFGSGICKDWRGFYS